ncbi:MAG: hypothetical protein HYZ42_14875 [Bacteroidetes bacterium]|nr:hypothetical protein [Bacteroidota bacterium]
MKRIILLIFSSTLSLIKLNSQTTLYAGDVLIVGINVQLVNSGYGCNWGSCSNSREIHVTSLVDLAPNTNFKITISGFNSTDSANASSNARTVSSILKWTNNSGSTIAKGTIISIYKDNSTGSFSSSVGICGVVSSACSCGSVGSTMGVSTSGGKYFIYQGSGSTDSTLYDYTATSAATATFNGRAIFLFHIQSSQANSGFLTSGSAGNFVTYCPQDLVNYSLAIGNHAQGACYSGPRTGLTVAQLRDSILNPANWTTASYNPSSSSVVNVPTTSFTFDNTPIFTGTNTKTICQNAKSISIDSNLTIYDTTQNTTLNWTIVSGPTHGSLSGFSASSSGSGSYTTPSGCTYTPTSGYSGSDAFIVMLSNGIDSVSQTININILNNVNPSVSINITSGAQTICTGNSITFEGSAINGGQFPQYKFYKNGIIIQDSTSTTYNSNSFVNNDSIYCIMMATNLCQNQDSAISNVIGIKVLNYVTPTLNIGNSLQTLCAGSSYSVNATSANAGVSPSYIFILNGNFIQDSSIKSYTSSSFVTNDSVSCILVANNLCQTKDTVHSSTIYLNVQNNLIPALSMTLKNNSSSICSGDSLVFKANPINAGTAPAFLFSINGIAIQNSLSDSFISNSLVNQDTVTCIMAAKNKCQTKPNAFSNDIVLNITKSVTPSIALSTSNGKTSICDGTALTFDATPTNSGTSPIYNFKVNGTSSQNGSNPNFTSSNLQNKDIVTCEMVANNICQTTNSAISNSIKITVDQNVIPSISLAITQGTQVTQNGTYIIYTATPTNGGSNPIFDFKINGISIQKSSSKTFATNTLNNKDTVNCVMIADNICQIIDTVTSNNIIMTVNKSNGFNNVSSNIFELSDPYPNPFTSEINISLVSSKYHLARFELIDYTGQIIYSSNYKITEGKNLIMIPTLYIQAGYFTFKITTEETSFQKSLIKLNH